MKTPLTCLSLIAAAGTLTAAPRSSANYGIVAETSDLGGRQVSSTDYANDGSAGAVTGISAAGSPAESAKHGYIGQLYEVTGFALDAMPPTIDETDTRQIVGGQQLDDGSLLAVDPESIAWSVLSGPITDISTAGLATADAVYADTPAEVGGELGSDSAVLELTVLDTIPDNFGTYAGDGLDDAWQVEHFGIDNPLAAPDMDPDGDWQDNRFEWTAGTAPLDPASRFLLRIEPCPTGFDLTFGPIFAGRQYVTRFGSDLQNPDAWQVLDESSAAEDAATTTVPDTDPGDDPLRFYRVEITRP